MIRSKNYSYKYDRQLHEDNITHSIFYTAVTRARKHLRIFWTPETQQGVLKSLRRDVNAKDINLLASRRGLYPVN